MTIGDEKPAAVALSAFLAQPLDRRRFDQFFRLCSTETLKHLRRLRAAGWRLPEDQVQQEHALEDISLDILGSFLASRKDRPFHVVFDYFQRHGITVYDEADAEDLLRHFRILLRGFIGKELTIIRGIADPQVRNLKRRITETLRGPDYRSETWPSENQEYVFLQVNTESLRESLPTIPRDRLTALAKQAFHSSRNRTDWCAAIFNLLYDENEYRNALPIHALISVMVAANAEFVEHCSPTAGHLPTPTEDLLRRRVAAATDGTLDWLRTTVIRRQVDRGRLSTDDAPLVLKACRRYFEDFGRDGETDSVPSYFISLKPGLTQTEYLREYKYVMDTATERGVEELRRLLRNDSTIWPFGGYSPDEE